MTHTDESDTEGRRSRSICEIPFTHALKRQAQIRYLRWYSGSNRMVSRLDLPRIISPTRNHVNRQVVISGVIEEGFWRIGSRILPWIVH